MPPNKRNKTNDPGIYGNIPPQAKDVEEAILGAIMLEREAIDAALEYLSPEVFYITANQLIFQAIIDLHKKSQPIDILTVSEQLRANGTFENCGGSYYVTRLTNSVVSGAHVEAHARIIYQKHIQRKMIELGSRLIREGYQDGADVFEMIDEAEKSIFNVTGAIHKKNYKGLDAMLVKAVTEIETNRHKQQDISGVTSGYRAVDKITHGWQNTDLVILAARPGVGKTALALNLARNAANAGTPVAFFSLEMSEGQLIRRLMSAESEIPLDKIQRSRMEDDDMKQLYVKAIQPLSNKKLFIDDTPALNVFELRAKARRLKTKENIGLIIIDYLQLMSGTQTGGNQRNREQEISEISRNLKKLAKELDVPVLALSQLSRATENRANKKPQLSDLRESGAIEQDADAVIFIYRAEYYGLHRDANGESNPGETVIDFAKYRNGSPGATKLRAQLWIQKFIEFEEATKPAKNKDGVTTKWKPFKDQADKDDEIFK